MHSMQHAAYDRYRQLSTRVRLGVSMHSQYNTISSAFTNRIRRNDSLLTQHTCSLTHRSIDVSAALEPLVSTAKGDTTTVATVGGKRTANNKRASERA